MWCPTDWIISCCKAYEHYYNAVFPLFQQAHVPSVPLQTVGMEARQHGLLTLALSPPRR